LLGTALRAAQGDVTLDPRGAAVRTADSLPRRRLTLVSVQLLEQIGVQLRAWEGRSITPDGGSSSTRSRQAGTHGSMVDTPPSDERRGLSLPLPLPPLLPGISAPADQAERTRKYIGSC
jgi:hypothetical protein